MSLGMQFGSGYSLGTGSALNVEVGYIPDVVDVYNLTDGTPITRAFLTRIIPFTSGGPTEIVAGNKIIGATSHATAIVGRVILVSGTWAGGDAAGFFVIANEELTGTFGSENVLVGSGTNDATVTAAVTYNVATAAAAASATGNAAISPYRGVAGTNARGFTMGSTVSVSGKLLGWCCWRNG